MNERLIAAIAGGAPYAAIASDFGITAQAVGSAAAAARRHGTLTTKRPGGRPGHVAEIIALAVAGRKPKEVATALAVSRRYAADVIGTARRAGAPIPVYTRSTAVRDEVVSMAQSGIRPAEIAARLGLPSWAAGSIIQSARRNGVAIAPFTGDSLEARAVALVLEGIHPREVAARLGWTDAAVHQACSRARARGVPVPKSKPGRVPAKAAAQAMAA
jgi:transposase